MKKARLHKIFRKWHRYLGVIFGVQVLLWTIGGLYFSWTNSKHIKGDDIRKEEPPLNGVISNITPSEAIETIIANDSVKQINTIQLVTVLDSIYYQIVFNNGSRNKARLVNASTGVLKPLLTSEEAIAVAKSRLKVNGDVKSIEFITETNGHHEYRKKPLPVYALTFGGEVNSTVYVSPELGTVQSLRNTQWRIYDFLWMLHTMDFQKRSDFNNWLLRFFSVASLLAILSGFALFFISSKKKRIKK